MMYLCASLLVVVNAFWLVLTLLMLPGNWMMVATTGLVAWWQWDKGMFSPWTLAAIAALAAAGEVVEFASSAFGVRKVGGTRGAALALGGPGLAPTAASTASTSISSSAERMSKRWTRFLSSRILPGQS